VTDKKGAAFFTNCEHGMSIANQISSSPDFSPIGKTQELFKRMPQYPQSDEIGWQETLEGKITEERDEIEKARRYFKQAFELSRDDKSKQQRLKWFNAVHSSTPEKKAFTQPLETFVGKYTNPYNDLIEMDIENSALIYKQFDKEIKLVRISETDFLPEKDQFFKNKH
jgi:hypothetical protein